MKFLICFDSNIYFLDNSLILTNKIIQTSYFMAWFWSSLHGFVTSYPNYKLLFLLLLLLVLGFDGIRSFLLLLVQVTGSFLGFVTSCPGFRRNSFLFVTSCPDYRLFSWFCYFLSRFWLNSLLFDTSYRGLG